MSNFVSGIFKKCKYGGYFIIYLIAFINLIGFGFCDLSLTTTNSYNNISGKQTYSSNHDLMCVVLNSCTNYDNYNFLFIVSTDSIGGGQALSLSYYGDGNNLYKGYGYCTPEGYLELNVRGNATCNYTINEYDYINYTAQQCKTEYNLVDNSQLTNCQNDLTSCQTTINNTICETNIQFQDISNGVGVKTLNSRFSPFSGANNNSVYYDSTENEIQIDQYGDAEIISKVQSTPGNCSSCENDLSTCQGNLSSCGTSLSSCNSDLTACLEGNVGTGDYNWSAIFINNIQHIGKPIINITIPEEIARDYTGTENSFNLTVDGYGYDEEKMINMIDIQNYKPTGEEMSQLISKFADFVPLLGIGLLFIAIRYIAKRIFKG